RPPRVDGEASLFVKRNINIYFSLEKVMENKRTSMINSK
ncbi:unnamed protein product, partial [Brassica rapa subsp. trilocularis]